VNECRKTLRAHQTFQSMYNSGGRIPTSGAYIYSLCVMIVCTSSSSRSIPSSRRGQLEAFYIQPPNGPPGPAAPQRQLAPSRHWQPGSSQDSITCYSPTTPPELLLGLKRLVRPDSFSFHNPCLPDSPSQPRHTHRRSSSAIGSAHFDHL
jgi:hypothetical protein